jgi:site-specific recombinase XerD
MAEELMEELGQVRPLDDIELCFVLLRRLHARVSVEKPYSIAEEAMPSQRTKTARRDGSRQATVGKGSAPKSRKRRLPKTITRDEAHALMQAPNLRAPTGLRNRCMFELMYRAGLRVGEVCALELRDVDLARGRVRVLAGKSGDRTAYFDPGSVTPLIDRWKERRRLLGVPKEAPLFCTLKGGRVSTEQVRQTVHRAALRAGINPRKVTPHVLRHTFATELLEEGVHVRKVQELLGHRDLSTTEVYLHIVDADLDEVMRKRKRYVPKPTRL